MADRRVTGTRKDDDGDITALCGDVWESVSKALAIAHIENGTHTYYVNVTRRVDVRVVDRNGKKHLQTTPDATDKNNLDNLPDC